MLRRLITAAMLSGLLWLPASSAREPSADTQTDALVLEAVLSSQCQSSDGFVLLSLRSISPSQDAELGSADESGAFDDLKRRNGSTATLPSSISCRGVHVLEDRKVRQLFEGGKHSVDKDLLGDRWKQFYARFPSATGWMSLSLPGYTADGDIAIVYQVVRCGSLCGQGMYVYLHRVNGQWKVLVRFPVWVS